MLPAKYLSAALVAILHVLVCFAEDEPKVEIEVVSKPDNCERKTKKYDQLKMHYIGTLAEDGTKFDASHDRNEPFAFQLGVGQVIKGWDQGTLDMCIGEKRKLSVPAVLGYGDAGAGDKIPPKADLKFEIELVDIEDGQAPENVFKMIDSDKDKKLTKDEVSNYIKVQMEQGGAPGDDQGAHDKMIDEIFTHEDKDQDGFISHDEFSGPKHDEL